MTTAPIRYFLGAATPLGFDNTAPDLYDCHDGWQVYILKSGPGTGKSTLLRRICEMLQAADEEVEVFCCSADIHSLDAVRCPGRKLLCIDGTAPHTLDPQYWSAAEHVVPLSVCTDDARLHTQADTLVALTDEKQRHTDRYLKYLRAAASLLSDSRRIQTSTLDDRKICRLAQRIARTEYGDSSSAISTSSRRFLSAVTADGVSVFYDTLQAICPRIYVIEDEYGAASARLLSVLAEYGTACGHHVIACPCPLAPTDGPEHLLLPDIGVGFTTSNSFHTVDFPVFRRIHASRFTDSEALRLKRARLSFNRRAAVELLSEAASSFEQAGLAHAELEAINASAMDWSRYDRLCEHLIARLQT